MTKLIKDRFNDKTLRQFALDIQAVYPQFAVAEFVKATTGGKWHDLELKERIYQISATLGKFLPPYENAIEIIDKVVESSQGGLHGFWIFPTFVQIYGQAEENWDITIEALARYTKYSTSEFAVRPFIIKNEQRMRKQLLAWAQADDEHIRRLASEGCRPQLPWAQGLQAYKNDPTPLLPILQQLNSDPALYVRKSVANNLNDISKTHPDLVVDLAKRWYGQNEATNWIVKHGCRTLLKKGNRDVLAIFGYHDIESLTITNFTLKEATVLLGDSLTFSLTIQTTVATKLRLEYGVDYVKAGGKRNQKIFQISETALKANETRTYTKKHALANLSTRKHYPGTHSITLIVNGRACGTRDFELVTN